MPVARPVPRGVCVPRGIIFVTSGAAREREREEQRISSCTFACVHLSWGGAACARVQLSYPKNAHAAPASSGERVAKTRRSVCVFTERTFTSCAAAAARSAARGRGALRAAVCSGRAAQGEWHRARAWPEARLQRGAAGFWVTPECAAQPRGLLHRRARERAAVRRGAARGFKSTGQFCHCVHVYSLCELGDVRRCEHA